MHNIKIIVSNHKNMYYYLTPTMYLIFIIYNDSIHFIELLDAL